MSGAAGEVGQVSTDTAAIPVIDPIVFHD